MATKSRVYIFQIIKLTILIFQVLLICYPKFLESCPLFQIQPLVFCIGDGTMMRGLEIAVKAMREGELSIINIHAQYMTGIKDVTIPSNLMNITTFMFHLRLLKIMRKEIVVIMDEGRKTKEGIEKAFKIKEEGNGKNREGIEKALKIKEEGNSFYQQEKFKEAQAKYEEVLFLCVFSFRL